MKDDGRDPALRLDDVTMRFGGIVAVNAVSLTVNAGERWAVIGPNGAGKTTLFHVVSGEILPTSGQVLLFGDDVTRMAAHRRAKRGLGRTYQVTNVFQDLTVKENVALAQLARTRARYRSWWPLQISGELASIIDESLESAGLLHRREVRVNELSHGEQRQLEIAIALAGQPRVLLLDEPAAGLSSAERKLMRTVVSELPPELSVILIEHDMSIALDLADNVICLDDGRPIARGTPDEIRTNDEVRRVYLRSD